MIPNVICDVVWHFPLMFFQNIFKRTNDSKGQICFPLVENQSEFIKLLGKIFETWNGDRRS